MGVRHAEVAVISDELIKKVACADLDPANNNASMRPTKCGLHQAPDAVAVVPEHFQNGKPRDSASSCEAALDNNVLQEIDGIGHLVHLEWLDLSFNNISTIKGLENLVKLTDLRLLYLKCLEKLRVLNLTGNPVCSDPEYRPFLLAHLEKLKYLDYALVDENETVQAREQYQDDIEDAALAREAEQQKYLSMLKDANVIILETLLTDMFREDTEMNKIEVLPGLRNIIDDYTEKAKAAAEDVKLVLLEKHANLTNEVDGFKATYEKLQADAQGASIRAVETHRRTAKQLLKQATAAHSASASDADGSGSAAGLQLLHDAEVSSDKLHNELMNLESDVVETAQELITAMESSIDAVGSEARDIATEHFRTIEVLENNFFENVSQLAVTLLERMASDDGEDDDYLTDECRAILNDRDALNNAINGSHDIHIGKLLAQEDAMREQSLAKVAEIVKGAKEQEWSRNRARIAEVLHLKEKHLTEINRVRDEINRVDEEFY
ncbi:Leucine-rich repeat domain, L domain-like [Phytophthora cactorum]|nr:Leucine-rich repeat domain, L domain-like [Phytophthora cactorum]